MSILVAHFLVQFVVGFTPFWFNAPYEFTLLFNLRSLIHGLTVFGWLRVRILSRTLDLTEVNKNDSVSAQCKLRLSPCARRVVQTTLFIIIC